MNLICNQAGRELIKHFEGCRLKAYQDQRGIWTIGWGTTFNVVEGMVCTQAQADTWFDLHLEAEVEKPLNECLGYELDENQFSALCSFAYNIGIGNFKKSAVFRAINKGDFDDVPIHIAAWKYADGKVLGGLEARRNAEIKLWNTPVPDDPESEEDLIS